MEQFDVFIFGTGVAGQSVARQCVEAGKKTAIIDYRGYGGTCSQRGCDPKKLMLAAVEAHEFAKNMLGKGIVETPELDLNAARKYAKKYTENIPSKTEEALKNAGITCYHGNAQFIDAHIIELGDLKIQATNFVIATGMQPRKLGIPGEKHLLTSEDFFELQKAPEKVVFVGGGYVGMEFSHMLNSYGSNVTVIERGDQILAPFESYTATILEQASTTKGIEIIKQAQVSSIEEKEGRYIVHYAINGTLHQITTDCVFNTAGRVPSIHSLALEKAGVVTDQDGIVTNSRFQSSTQPHIYACGDASNQNLPLTPLSGREAGIVAHNITKGVKESHVPLIPSVAFTIPNCGGIGMTEKQAENSNRSYRVIEKDTSDWFNNRRINAGPYAYKLILEKYTDLILGAHIIGDEASEQLNMFAIAIQAGMTFSRLQETIFTYPSWGNDLISFKQ